MNNFYHIWYFLTVWSSLISPCVHIGPNKIIEVIETVTVIYLCPVVVIYGVGSCKGVENYVPISVFGCSVLEGCRL